MLTVNIEDDSLETLVPSLRSVPLSFQFLCLLYLLTCGRREKLSVLWLFYLENSGKAGTMSQRATSVSAQRRHGAGDLPRNIQVPACFCCFHRQDKDIRLCQRQTCAFTLGAVPGENYSPGFHSKAAALYFWADISFAG